jgi:hypothetical protein
LRAELLDPIWVIGDDGESSARHALCSHFVPYGVNAPMGQIWPKFAGVFLASIFGQLQPCRQILHPVAAATAR